MRPRRRIATILLVLQELERVEERSSFTTDSVKEVLPEESKAPWSKFRV